MIFDFRDMIETMQDIGIVDIILPFILIFSIFFAILQKTKLLGKDKEGKPYKNFNIIISLAMGFAFIIPHIIGKYEPIGDPVLIINRALPQIMLIMIVGLAFFIIAGLLGIKPKNYFNSSLSFITLILLNVFVINAYPSLADFMLIISAYIIMISFLIDGDGTFGRIPVIIILLVFMIFHWAITGWDLSTPSWLSWLEDSSTQSIIIIILTFFTIISFIMRKEKK